MNKVTMEQYVEYNGKKYLLLGIKNGMAIITVNDYDNLGSEFTSVPLSNVTYL